MIFHKYSPRTIIGIILFIIFPFITYSHWFTYSNFISSLVVKVKSIVSEQPSRSNENLKNNNTNSKKLTPEYVDLANPIYYEQRFKHLKNEIPKDMIVGYMTDRGGVYSTHTDYWMTQYVLAPVIIYRDIDRELIIGNFSNSEIISEITPDTIYCANFYPSNQEIMNKFSNERGLFLVGPKKDELAHVTRGPDGGIMKCSSVNNLILLKDFGDGVALFKRGEAK
tara:strand:+ start:1158 stop:1829 length:672 start_codon:yes stop_codon:yes gene_type:complete